MAYKDNLGPSHLGSGIALIYREVGTVTMLRISKLNAVTDATSLRLDGNLSGVWVEELRRLCETSLADGERITIDCGGISFSDSEGVALMRELLGRKVGLTNCSPFLKFQLKQGSAI